MSIHDVKNKSTAKSNGKTLKNTEPTSLSVSSPMHNDTFHERTQLYPQALGAILHHIFEPLWQRKPHMRMMMDWPLIVGTDLAKWTWPVKMLTPRHGPGVLYVQVGGAHYFQAWSQSAIYVERVNGYMGYGAVKRVHFVRVDGELSTSHVVETHGSFS